MVAKNLDWWISWRSGGISLREAEYKMSNIIYDGYLLHIKYSTTNKIDHKNGFTSKNRQA